MSSKIEQAPAQPLQSEAQKLVLNYRKNGKTEPEISNILGEAILIIKGLNDERIAVIDYERDGLVNFNASH